MIERTWALELCVHGLKFFPACNLGSLQLLCGDNDAYVRELLRGLDEIMNVKHSAIADD